MFAKGNGIGQILFKGSSTNAAIHGQAGKKIFDCLQIVHLITSAGLFRIFQK